MNEIDKFRADLESTPDFLDPEGIRHHEFKRGGHGRKLDFSAVKKTTALYSTWKKLNKQQIEARHPALSNLIILGIANGTTQFAFDVARDFFNRGSILPLKTEKNEKSNVQLTYAARLLIEDYVERKTPTVVILEDVGTTGFTSGNVALECREMGIQNTEVQVTWQRSSTLEFLDKHQIPYYNIIKQVLPTLSPELCQRQSDCSKGVELIPYGK